MQKFMAEIPQKPGETIAAAEVNDANLWVMVDSLQPSECF